MTLESVMALARQMRMEDNVDSKGIARRRFIGGLVAFGTCAGCKSPWWVGTRPLLRFGVISDIHVTTPESADRFRRALSYFRDRGADAVMVAGDLSDWGLRSGFKYVADAWYDVFPNDRGADGERVEKLFITGNHDHDGWWYGDMTLDMHVQGYSENDALVRFGMKECWEEAFHEPYSEMRRRTVKGFDFISAEWLGVEKPENDAKVVKWFEDHRGELCGDKPFFFFRHAPLIGTVSSSVGRIGSSILTDCLRGFPNCIAFNGHTHWTFNDERSIWQEEFTAISIPSMSFTSLPKGYENGQASADGSCTYSMEKIASRTALKEAQGYFVSLFDDRMEVQRYDFERMQEAASPWIVPLGRNRAKPYSVATHAMATPVPRFPAGSIVGTRMTNAALRNDNWTVFITLEFPSAKADGGRTFDYVVRAEREDGTVVAEKRYLSPAFHLMPDEEPAMVRFRFDARAVPEIGRYRFKVYPRNCFGAEGDPITSRIFESCPGKDKVAGDCDSFGRPLWLKKNWAEE